MPVSIKEACIGGELLSIAGNDDDPYFQSIAVFAAQTDLLHRFVSAHVLRGVILDVGANIGLTSLAMSLASPNSRVVAFEPSPENAKLFSRNTLGHEQITLERRGLGDVAGHFDFIMPLAGANAHVATPNYEFAQHPDFRPIRVPITTLDDYLTTLGTDDRIEFIKIDVEGFEPNVLAGAQTLIRVHQPLIWMEFNSVALNVAHGYSPIAFARALFSCFDVLRVVSNNELDRIPGPSELVHDNMTLKRSIEDIVLRPRPGCTIPDVESMTLPGTAAAELKRLRPKAGYAPESP
jgi:FkbM family methyltransferase